MIIILLGKLRCLAILGNQYIRQILLVHLLRVLFKLFRSLAALLRLLGDGVSDRLPALCAKGRIPADKECVDAFLGNPLNRRILRRHAYQHVLEWIS